MASRDDVDVLWHLDPRIIVVAEPSTEINVQDLHDTLRDKEQEVQNLIYPSIVSTAGGESLGGGVTVGLTSTLQNAKLAFQARREWVVSGLADGTDPTGRFLTDNEVDFLASGIVPGSWVVNLTDASIATVLNVDSATTLRLDGLGGGDINEWNPGDDYRVMEVTQVEINGGNLVSVDENDLEIDAILPTAGTQVVRTSAASATTQNQAQLEHSTFNGAVHVDAINGVTGTDYPRGTQALPCSNIMDAKTIALERGFSRLHIISDYTLDTGDNVENFVLIGENSGRTTITVLPGAETADVEINQARVTGQFDTAATFHDCALVDIEFVEANIHRCVLEGTITLAGSGQTAIYDSNDGLVQNAPPPAIDFNGSGRALSIRNYHGDIHLYNKSGPEDVEININTGGRVLLDSTITNGGLRLTGIIEVVDNSTGTAVVDTSHVIYPDQLQLAAFDGHIHINTASGVAGTKFPAGTKQDPCNNIADALTIAEQRGLTELQVEGMLVVPAGVDISGYELSGANVINTAVVLQSGVVTNRTKFEDLVLVGTLDGPVFATNCSLQNLVDVGSDDFPTLFERCVVRQGIVRLRNGLTTAQNIHFINCFSGIPGSGTFTLDMNNSDSPLAFRQYNGGVTITNWTGGQTSTMSFADGQLRLDATCTNGDIQLDGRVVVTDNSTGTFTCSKRSYLNADYIADTTLAKPVADLTDTTTIGGFIANKVLTVVKFLGLK